MEQSQPGSGGTARCTGERQSGTIRRAFGRTLSYIRRHPVRFLWWTSVVVGLLYVLLLFGSWGAFVMSSDIMNSRTSMHEVTRDFTVYREVRVWYGSAAAPVVTVRMNGQQTEYELAPGCHIQNVEGRDMQFFCGDTRYVTFLNVNDQAPGVVRFRLGPGIASVDLH